MSELPLWLGALIWIWATAACIASVYALSKEPRDGR